MSFDDDVEGCNSSVWVFEFCVIGLGVDGSDGSVLVEACRVST